MSQRINEKLIRIIESSGPLHLEGQLYSEDFGRFLGFSDGIYYYAADWVEGGPCYGIAQISSKLDYRLKAIDKTRGNINKRALA